MKLNNKGVTLVELIVSFAIVGVAIVYFFQTLTTVNKLYYKAREETNKFVDKDYALRIVDADISNIVTSCFEDSGEDCHFSDYIDGVYNNYNSVWEKVKIDSYDSSNFIYSKDGQPIGALVKFDLIDENGNIIASLYKYIKEP